MRLQLDISDKESMDTFINELQQLNEQRKPLRCLILNAAVLASNVDVGGRFDRTHYVNHLSKSALCLAFHLHFCLRLHVLVP